MNTLDPSASTQPPPSLASKPADTTPVTVDSVLSRSESFASLSSTRSSIREDEAGAMRRPGAEAALEQLRVKQMSVQSVQSDQAGLFDGRWAMPSDFKIMLTLFYQVPLLASEKLSVERDLCKVLKRVPYAEQPSMIVWAFKEAFSGGKERSWRHHYRFLVISRLLLESLDQAHATFASSYSDQYENNDQCEGQKGDQEGCFSMITALREHLFKEDGFALQAVLNEEANPIPVDAFIKSLDSIDYTLQRLPIDVMDFILRVTYINFVVGSLFNSNTSDMIDFSYYYEQASLNDDSPHVLNDEMLEKGCRPCDVLIPSVEAAHQFHRLSLAGLHFEVTDRLIAYYGELGVIKGEEYDAYKKERQVLLKLFLPSSGVRPQLKESKKGECICYGHRKEMAKAREVADLAWMVIHKGLSDELVNVHHILQWINRMQVELFPPLVDRPYLEHPHLAVDSFLGLLSMRKMYNSLEQYESSLSQQHSVETVLHDALEQCKRVRTYITTRPSNNASAQSDREKALEKITMGLMIIYAAITEAEGVHDVRVIKLLHYHYQIMFAQEMLRDLAAEVGIVEFGKEMLFSQLSLSDAEPHGQKKIGRTQSNHNHNRKATSKKKGKKARRRRIEHERAAQLSAPKNASKKETKASTSFLEGSPERLRKTWIDFIEAEGRVKVYHPQAQSANEHSAARETDNPWGGFERVERSHKSGERSRQWALLDGVVKVYPERWHPNPIYRDETIGCFSQASFNFCANSLSAEYLFSQWPFDQQQKTVTNMRKANAVYHVIKHIESADVMKIPAEAYMVAGYLLCEHVAGNSSILKDDLMVKQISRSTRINEKYAVGDGFGVIVEPLRSRGGVTRLAKDASGDRARLVSFFRRDDSFEWGEQLSYTDLEHVFRSIDPVKLQSKRSVFFSDQRLTGLLLETARFFDVNFDGIHLGINIEKQPNKVKEG